MMLRNARNRAKRFGLKFDLTRDDLVIPKRCPVLGIPLRVGRGRNSHTDNSPSLDRVIPRKGYVRGNVIVISWRANRIKNNGTTEELMRIAVFLKTLEVIRRCGRAGLSL